jgi:hypothetical protein
MRLPPISSFSYQDVRRLGAKTLRILKKDRPPDDFTGNNDSGPRLFAWTRLSASSNSC